MLKNFKKRILASALMLALVPSLALAYVTQGDINRLSGLVLQGVTSMVVTTLTATTGTITTLTGTTQTATTSNATTQNVGASGTAGTLNVFPATAANGILKLLAVNNSGAFNSTISNKNIGQATVYSLPDCGAGTCDLLTTAGSQSVTGQKTFTAPVLGAATATTINKVTITAPASAATLTIPNGVTLTGPASSGTAATLANAETFTNKTLTDFIDNGTTVSSAISATSGTTGTTLTNIPGLSVAVTAGKTYAFMARVTGTSTTNGGVKFAFANSGSTTSASYTCIQNNGTTQNAHSGTTTMGNAVAATTTVFTDAQCWGVVVVNAGGNLTMQFAQNASHADTTTVDANGFMSVRRLN